MARYETIMPASFLHERFSIREDFRQCDCQTVTEGRRGSMTLYVLVPFLTFALGLLLASLLAASSRAEHPSLLAVDRAPDAIDRMPESGDAVDKVRVS